MVKRENEENRKREKKGIVRRGKRERGGVR